MLAPPAPPSLRFVLPIAAPEGKFFGKPPMKKPGSSPACARIHAHIADVVVLPCVPVTTSGLRPTEEALAQCAGHRRLREPELARPDGLDVVATDGIADDDEVVAGLDVLRLVAREAANAGGLERGTHRVDRTTCPSRSRRAPRRGATSRADPFPSPKHR